MKTITKIFSWLIFFFLVFIWAFYSFYLSRPIKYGAGQVAPNNPVQIDLVKEETIDLKGFKVTKKAEFELTGRVLSKKRYYMDEGAKFSPIDFAIGWGLMSDEEVFKELDINQMARWYSWRTDNLEEIEEIKTHSANMHMIPANNEIRKKLFQVRKGELINIKGYLVYIEGPDGRRWNSSLSREDKGGGACEIILVEEIILDENSKYEEIFQKVINFF